MHHKRKRPKNRRAGCGLCKPHKRNGAKKKDKPSVARLTRERIEQLLREALPGARELDAQLQRVFTPTAATLAFRLD